MEKIKLYLWLAYINLFISSFTFGGGYIVVSMIDKYYVKQKHLFSEDELMEMAAIGQSSPGAIAINLSVLAGKRVAGYWGVCISGICAIIPPIVILSLISSGYEAFSSNLYVIALLKGMQACVAALIVDLVIDMYALIIKERSPLLNMIVPFSFICCFILNMNVAIILVLSSIICMIQLYIKSKGEKTC